MQSLGKRLFDERERLGLSQPALAEVGGVTMRSQRNYEKDERQPDAAYLAAIAQAGADVLYILTGQRSQPVLPTADLSPRQRALLANYEAADENGKRVVEGAAGLAAQSTSGKRRA